MKFLAIKFKFLGDIALMTTSLRALKEAFPDAQIHCLVADSAKPILEHIPWIDRVWTISKKNYGNIFTTLQQLREENFDLSVDFVGNDRGALFSYFIGAETRLGPVSDRGFLGREYCYHLRVPEPKTCMHEVDKELRLLSKLHISEPRSLSPELYSDPKLIAYAQEIIKEKTILCHIGTSAASKEWPVFRWAELWTAFPEIQGKLLFTAGPSVREQELLSALKQKIPKARFLEIVPRIPELMAIVNQCEAVISGDTFVAHLAAGLKVPVVVLYGPTTSCCWAPKDYCVPIEAPVCHCRHFFYKCTHATHCLSKIPATEVALALNQALERYGKK